jgi:DNA-binding CsgD family transcriptional regulator/PAS domain-containing protein
MPSKPESELMRLVLAAHEAATEPSVWPTFLADYARLVGADITIIQRHHLSQHRSAALATFGMSQRFTDSYNNYYSRVNVWREHGRHLYATGRIVLDPEMYPRPLLKRCEFYNDCLLPNGGTHSMAGVVACKGDEAVVLTSLREDGKEGWEEGDRPTVGILLPHVARARATEERLHLLEAGETVLNGLDLGVLLLASDGRVCFRNRAAESILHARDGLSLRNERIVASDSDTEASLQRLLRYAIAPGESIECPPGVLVPRAEFRRPYYVTAAPLRRTLRPFLGMTTPIAVVLITDPERHRTVAGDTLKEMYGLTPKEATLAIMLGEGLTLAQAAERLEMRYETARTHLRRILSKTETARQTDLVLLVERLSRHTLPI